MKRADEKIRGLALAEWAFYESCPAEFLKQCRDYEYARHCPSIIERYEREAAANKTMDSGVVNFYRSGFDEDGGFAEANVIRLPAGFPSKPFLETDYGHLEATPPATGFHAEFEIRAELQRVSNGPPIVVTYNEELPEERFPYNALLKVDLRYSVNALKDEFARWLEQHRKKRPDEISRAGVPGTTLLRKDLKALAVFRLLDPNLGLSIQAAKDYVVGFRHKIQDPPYRGAGEWSKAKKHAKDLIAEFGKCWGDSPPQ